MIEWLRRFLVDIGLVEPRCRVCGVTVGDKYWRAREALAFANVMRLICESRNVCVDCGIAEEKVRRGIA